MFPLTMAMFGDTSANFESVSLSKWRSCARTTDAYPEYWDIIRRQFVYASFTIFDLTSMLHMIRSVLNVYQVVPHLVLDWFVNPQE